MEGLGWYTYEVVKRMVEQHPEDEFLFFFDRRYDPAFVFEKNVTPVVLFPPARHPFLWWWWFEISNRKALKRFKPDVYFSPDGYLCLSTNVPTVMVTHDIAHVHYPTQIPFLVRQYYRYFVPNFLKKATFIATISEFSKFDIIQYYGIKSEKIKVIPNGCRPEFVPLKEQEKKRFKEKYAGGHDYFFYLGSIHPRKNVDRLLEAFDLFKSNHTSTVKLLVAGRMAWQSKPVKAAWQKMKHRDEVIFLDYLPDNLLPGMLGSALALIYVSLFEGFGLPVIEAMNCEVPVITSNTSSLPEVAGEAALCVDPTDTQQIANAMARISKDAHLRSDLIQLGKDQKLKFDWDKTAAKIYNLLQQAVKI